MRHSTTPEIQFSPHAWGWSENKEKLEAAVQVFPTRVGMVRPPPGVAGGLNGFPHTRGDGPACHGGNTVANGFSPHAWGWSEMRHQPTRC